MSVKDVPPLLFSLTRALSVAACLGSCAVARPVPASSGIQGYLAHRNRPITLDHHGTLNTNKGLLPGPRGRHVHLSQGPLYSQSEQMDEHTRPKWIYFGRLMTLPLSKDAS